MAPLRSRQGSAKASLSLAWWAEFEAGRKDGFSERCRPRTLQLVRGHPVRAAGRRSGRETSVRVVYAGHWGRTGVGVRNRPGPRSPDADLALHPALVPDIVLPS